MMDGSPPTERSHVDLRRSRGAQSGRVRADQPPQPSSTEWLSEFLQREGIAETLEAPPGKMPVREPVSQPQRRKPYPVRVIAGGVLLAAGLAGAVVYDRTTLNRHAHHAAPPAIAPSAVVPPQPPVPPLAQPPAQASGERLPQVKESGSVAGLPDVPRQPVPLTRPARPVQSSPPTPTSRSSEPIAVNPPLPKPPVVPPAEARPLAASAAAAAPKADGLHLQIIHPASGPAETSRMDALISGLRAEVGDIASATVTTGPASSQILVVYFSAEDHASARRIAASLARIERAPYQLMLGHERPLPSPGTIEIRLPRS